MNTITEVLEVLGNYKQSVEMARRILEVTNVPGIEEMLEVNNAIICRIDRLQMELRMMQNMGAPYDHA